MPTDVYFSYLNLLIYIFIFIALWTSTFEIFWLIRVTWASAGGHEWGSEGRTRPAPEGHETGMNVFTCDDEDDDELLPQSVLVDSPLHTLTPVKGIWLKTSSKTSNVLVLTLSQSWRKLLMTKQDVTDNIWISLIGFHTIRCSVTLKVHWETCHNLFPSLKCCGC